MIIPPRELGFINDFLAHVYCLGQYRSSAVPGAQVSFIIFNEWIGAACQVCWKSLSLTEMMKANNLEKCKVLRRRKIE
ncbi:hypothetical protein LCGC14_1693560 [marine sediment metagenome]|uniref:Uncharacterized protein n=1 Tax=marine sediment metagenome TaxID=412755 RepID=A0A0F9HKM4_9ZZZZ